MCPSKVQFYAHVMDLEADASIPSCFGMQCNQISIGTEGSKGLKALAVAPVSLIADGMLPLSTPVCVLLFVLHCLLHLVLSLSVWLLGRENEMRFVILCI